MLRIKNLFGTKPEPASLEDLTARMLEQTSQMLNPTPAK